MNKPFLVGITGGIGSGKSLICRIFSILDIPVYDADTRAKWLMVHDPDLVNGILTIFGQQAYKGGELNRNYLAAKTFHDKYLTERLNSLVHPAVGKDFADWAGQQESNYVIKEAALLIESGSYKSLDFLVNVEAPASLRKERVLKRDAHRDPQQVEDIMLRQLSDKERREKADYTVRNDGEHMVIPQVLELDGILRQRAGI